MQMAATSQPFQVLLVDDSPSFLESALRFLSSDARIEVVGLALTGREAIEQIEIVQPDLVLMDWQMPDMDGLTATQQIKATSRPPSVIILTLHDSDEYRDAAFKAHADGFIAKSDFGLKLLPLIEQVLSARVTLPAEFAAPNSTSAGVDAAASRFDQSSRDQSTLGQGPRAEDILGATSQWESHRSELGCFNAFPTRPLFSFGIRWKN